MIGVRNRDILVEGERLLSFGDNFCLEIDNCWIQEEPRLLTNSSNTSPDAFKIIIVACKFEWKNEVFGIIDIGGDIFEFELKRSTR